MAMLMASRGNWVVPLIIFLVIAFKVLGAIIKAAKEASESSSPSSGSDDQDLWQPRSKPEQQAPQRQTARRSAPPPVPSQRQAKRSAPPPVPGTAMAQDISDVTLPEGISDEAAMAIRTMESSDDRFERIQSQAYDLESSDIPMESDDAFSLTKKRRRSRKKYVKINLKGKRLRNAIIAREILALPRCFDI